MSHTSSTLAAPSYSRLSAFHNCRFKYFHHYVLGLEKVGSAVDDRMHAGSVGHVALDSLYRLGYTPIERAQAAITAAWAAHQPAESHSFLTEEHIQGLLLQYIERWPEADEDFRPIRLRPMDISAETLIGFDGTVDDDGYMIMAEKPMVVRLSNGQCVTVVLDLAVQRASGEVYVVDHKWTCDYLGGGLTNRYIISHQPRLYVLALQALLGDCAGAIINGVYMGEYANKPHSKAQRFDRYYYPYTDGQLQETLEWVKHTAEQMYEFEEYLEMEPVRGMKYVLQNDQAYHKNCEYLPLCEVSPAVRQQRINGLYQLKTER